MTWQLEVFKLALYITFPVGLFYVYNQPEIFEDWVVKTKRELYPPQAIGDTDELNRYIKKVKMDQEAQFIRQLQEEELEKRKQKM